jgi:hypothetical protein
VPSLPARVLEDIVAALDPHAVDPGEAESFRLIDRIRAALKPRRSVRLARKRKRAAKADKNAETASIRGAVFKRAEGRCELHIPKYGRCPQPASEMHHCFGRVRVRQSERNCLALCYLCHRDWTRNVPSAGDCWWQVATALDGLGFREEAGRAFVLCRRATARDEQSRQLRENRG